MNKKEYKTPLVATVVLTDELLENPIIRISGEMNPEDSDSKESTFDEDFTTEWEE